MGGCQQKKRIFVELRGVFCALRAQGRYFYSLPRGLRAPGPCGYFCPAAKVTKNAPEPMVLDFFLGAALERPPRRGLKDCAARFLVRRSLRISSTPSAALALVELRLPAFQRGTAVQGAHGLTAHFANLYPKRQTLVPSAARQPALPIELCTEVSTGIGPRHGR